MAIEDIFKISRKTFFNPSAWLGTKELSAYTRIIGSNLKTTFTTPKPEHIETFEQALQRLNVTETALQQNADRYKLFALLFLVFSVCAFLVGFYYLFRYGTLAGWVLAMTVALLFAVNALRFDFWRFQIRRRQLGCTFREWWVDKLGKTKGPTP